MNTSTSGGLVVFRAAALVGVLAFPVLAAAEPSAPAPGAGPASKALTVETAADRAMLALLEEDLDAQRRADPVGTSTRGDRRFDALLPDVSAGGIEAWLAETRTRLAAAQVLNAADLSPMRQTERAMLIDALETRIESARFRTWEMAVTQLNGPQYELPQMPQSLTFTTEKHLEDYVSRLEKVAGYIDETMNGLRAGVARGFTPPRVVLGSAASQALAHGSTALGPDPTRHALYTPFAGRSGPLAERAKRVILEQVAPAYERFGVFLRDEYVPRCRETLAASDLPDGKAYYEYRVRTESTLRFDAGVIHGIGLDEVARLRREMMGVIARSDFKPGDAAGDEAVFAAFVKYLRTDPRFYARTGAELIEKYRAAGKVIDAELPRLFELMPSLPWGVREMPRFIAPSSPTAYYYQGSIANGQAGYFVANTHALDQRPLYDVLPLTLHEAVPGHHFQVALSQELKDVPEWRTTTMYTGYVEGWALYAEKLGLEMGEDARSKSNPEGRGLFGDPYDDFGRLNFEMWRALRLVVDTGIHAQGWTRDRAIAFMEANSALSRVNIEREVDRYIAWPGQAVSYKLGELHLLRLRAHAEKELGERFNLRGFHRAVLARGAVPLSVLSEQIEEWIADVKAMPDN